MVFFGYLFRQDILTFAQHCNKLKACRFFENRQVFANLPLQSMRRLNIEIKAHCRQPKKIRERLLENGAAFIGTDHQVDTYFRVSEGRLKLREGTIENALIHYRRANQTGPKKSEVLLYQPTDGKGLKALLTSALGILVIVDKKRAIFFIDNVKFHLDEVRELGAFVEIEAIDRNGETGEAQLRRQCEYYLGLLEVRSDDLVEVSYSDLIIEKNK